MLPPFTKNRETSLDLARILAATLVVMIHVVIIQWFTLDVFDHQWKILNFYNMAASSAVPVFFMISGSLFLGKKEFPGIKQLFGKYIFKLSFLYLIWVIFYAMDTIGVRAVLAFDIQGIWNNFIYTPKYHLWYLPAMIGIYLLLPVLWCVAHYDNGKYLGYICMMFFLCRIKEFLDIITGSLPSPDFMRYLNYELSGYSGYFLLGYWLKQKSLKIRPRYLLAGFFLVSILGAIGGSIYSAKDGSPNNLFLNFLGLFVCIQAILLYCVFLQCKPKLSPRATMWISVLSKCTLFTYLFHPFVIEHLNDLYELLAYSLTPAVAVPIMTVLVQGICFCIALILIRIPFLRKFIA